MIERHIILFPRQELKILDEKFVPLEAAAKKPDADRDALTRQYLELEAQVNLYVKELENKDTQLPAAVCLFAFALFLHCLVQCVIFISLRAMRQGAQWYGQVVLFACVLSFFLFVLEY